MAERIEVYPADGRVIRDPFSGQLVPEDGARVVPSSYWHRLKRDGDITFTPPSASSSVLADDIDD